MRVWNVFLLGLAAHVSAVPQNTLHDRNNWIIGERVFTSSGPVDGHAASNRTQVSEYLGIPFAKPPVGDLRFEPPQKYTGDKVINGTNFVRRPLQYTERSGLNQFFSWLTFIVGIQLSSACSYAWFYIWGICHSTPGPSHSSLADLEHRWT